MIKNLARTEKEILSSWANNHSPLVSVSIIAYNHESFIADAINGALAQITTFPFEIIVYDDASTDKTADIIKAYELQYPHIIKTLLQKENQWQGKGINGTTRYVWPSAKGKYIAFCEGDDYWTDAFKLQKQVDFLENNPDYVVCYHNIRTVDEQNNTINPSFISPDACKDYTSIELKKGAFIHLLSACFRNCIVPFPTKFDKIAAGDLILTSILGKYGKGKYLANIDVGASYRLHSRGLYSAQPTSAKLTMRAASFLALSMYYRELGDNVIKDYFKDRYKWTWKDAFSKALKERNRPILKKLIVQKIFHRY